MLNSRPTKHTGDGWGTVWLFEHFSYAWLRARSVLERGYNANRYKTSVEQKDELRNYINQAINVLKNLIISAMPKWYNKRVTSKNGLWYEYFKRAEQDMNIQWDGIIWPIIKDFNFENVLELAP